MSAMKSNKDVIEVINEKFVGKAGIVMVCEGQGNGRPRYIGTFIKAECKSCNTTFRFTDALLLFFAPIGVLSIVDEEKEGSHLMKEMLLDLYIGDKSLGEIVRSI